LLPYIEQDNLFRNMTSGTPTGFVDVGVATPPWNNFASSWNAAQTKVNTFLCPSDATNNQAQYAMQHLWPTNGNACCYGAAWTASATVSALGKTNYVGSAGYVNSPSDTYTGYYTNRSKNTIEGAQDGSSNTIMFGEVQAHPASIWGGTPPPKVAWTWMASPSLATGWGGIMVTPGTDFFYRFSSSHQVVMFAMGDGSVRGFKKPTHWPNIVYISGINDGIVVDQGTLGG
jgi:hypothetical protein